jgi:DNA/RNA-binding domain of Phe-tRNA-synthetase-like protein
VGGEHFVPLGSDEEQPPQPGEVIYRDDMGVICRSWNWREADRTKLSASTTSAFLCIESLPELGQDALPSACAELAGLVTELLGGEAQIQILDIEHDEARLI